MQSASGTSDALHEKEGRWLVPPIHQWQFKDELTERLRVDETHSAHVRAAALAIVAQLDDDPEILDLVSWKIGSAPIGRHDDYLRALHRAEAAVRLAPENGAYLTTPGVALYRVGCDQEAIDTLNRATASTPRMAAGRPRRSSPSSRWPIIGLAMRQSPTPGSKPSVPG